MTKFFTILCLSFGILAWAYGSASGDKLVFARELCQQGLPENLQACQSFLTEDYIQNVSPLRMSTELCPTAGGARGQLVLRCFNKANVRFQMNIQVCDKEKTYRTRVQCVQSIFTQAENQRVANELARDQEMRVRASRNNSLRGPAEKLAAPVLVPAQPGAQAQ